MVNINPDYYFFIFQVRILSSNAYQFRCIQENVDGFLALLLQCLRLDDSTMRQTALQLFGEPLAPMIGLNYMDFR